MVIHPFVPSAQATSPCDPAKSAQTVPLPNGSKLPTASISAESSEEIFLCWTGFFTKLGPQIRLSPLPIFGVNNYQRQIADLVGFVKSKFPDEQELPPSLFAAPPLPVPAPVHASVSILPFALAFAAILQVLIKSLVLCTGSVSGFEPDSMC
jgi:hypothetical protein